MPKRPIRPGGVNRGESMALDSHYFCMTENLLDPSPVAWIRPGSFGNAATEEAPLETTVGENGVTVLRRRVDVEPTPFYAPDLKFTGGCVHRQNYKAHCPCKAIIRGSVTEHVSEC
jgi:Vanillate O-demethylase oxygenase C-terminal domain